MKRWKFLIQKEGKDTWQPIIEPFLELEQGRYRLVARAECAHLDLEIRITSETQENGQLLRNSQKHYRRTNAEGLVTIMPLSDLQPGRWKIRCCEDVLSELLGNCWQESLQLQVVPSCDWSESSSMSSEAEIVPSKVKASFYLEKLQRLLCQEIEPMLRSPSERDRASSQEKETSSNLQTAEKFEKEQIDEIAIDCLTPDDLSSESVGAVCWSFNLEQNFKTKTSSVETLPEKKPTRSPIEAQPLQIILDSETYSRVKDEPLKISGRIELKNSYSKEKQPAIALKRLLYEFRNPNTEAISILLVQSLENKTLPHVFSGILEIPPDWETPLLIGTVILETVTGMHAFRQPFLVSSDLKHSFSLSRSMTLPERQEDFTRTLDLMLTHDAVSPSLNLNLPEPTKMTKKLKHFASDSVQILPPKLNSAGKAKTETPQLPAFAQKRSRSNEKSQAIAPDRDSSQMTVEEAFKALQLEKRFLGHLNNLVQLEERESSKQQISASTPAPPS
jgi:hypothetical protein